MHASLMGQLFRGTLANVNGFIDAHVKPYEIGYGQFDYFLIISDYPGINQNDIAKRMNVGKAAVTKAVKVLLKSGLIERKTDPKDKRNYCLYCTESGEHLCDNFVLYQDRVHSELFKGFSEEERSQFMTMLQKVHENSKDIDKLT